jgi:hypothetical protein
MGEDGNVIRTVISEPSSDDHHIQEKVAEFTQHEDFRKRILAIVEEYTGSTVFERKIEDIIKRSLESDSTQAKLEAWFTRSFDKAIGERGWKNKSFWVPTIIAIVAAAAAIAGLFIKSH